MTIAGLFFLLMGFLIAGYISMFRMVRSTALPLLWFPYHLFFALFTWWYSFSKPVDATNYYRASTGVPVHFGLSGAFIIWLGQKIHDLFDASYLDMYLLFHLAGFLGICLFYRIVLDTVPANPSKKFRAVTLLLFFLPGLHLWTAGYGKDGSVFLGIMMVTWSLLRPRRRFWAAIIGLIIVFLMRPHITVLLLGAVGLAVLWGSQMPIRRRIVITAILAAVFASVLPVVMDMIGLSSLDLESVDTLIDKRAGYFQQTATAVDIRQYSLPVKILTYLYRPFYYDAQNLTAVVASGENTILVIFTIILLRGPLRHMFKIHPNPFFLYFNLFYFILGITIMAQMTPNIGLALRQKTMFLPSFFMLCLTAISVKYSLKKHVSRKAGGAVTEVPV